MKIYCVALVSIACSSPAAAIDLMDMKCREYRPLGDVLRTKIERPQAPYCAKSYMSFDEYSFQSCRSEMLEYQRKAEGFIECLKAENERLAEEFNQAVGAFNRAADQ